MAPGNYHIEIKTWRDKFYNPTNTDTNFNYLIDSTSVDADV